MTDLEISKALALAIGWQEDDLTVWTPERSPHRVYIKTFYGWPYSDLTEFDYRDPGVIWPIAERYDCFPRRWRDEGWIVSLNMTVFDTPAKAVALTVIGSAA